MGAGASTGAHGGGFQDVAESSAYDSSRAKPLSYHEVNELLLEASHLSEGDILRMFKVIDAECWDIESYAGVLDFLQAVLGEARLIPFCERLLLRRDHDDPGEGSVPESHEDEDLEGRQIVTGLWHFLTMDSTRLTAFLFSTYEDNREGLSMQELDAMLSDLHGATADDSPAAAATARMREKIAAGIYSGDAKGRVRWSQFHEALKGETAFLAPLYHSQDKVSCSFLV
jgi:hypothetical protein